MYSNQNQKKNEITNKKKTTFKYTLKNDEGERFVVCNSFFFLGTLGYKPKKDIIISHLFKETTRYQASICSILDDKRGKASKNLYGTDEIKSQQSLWFSLATLF